MIRSLIILIIFFSSCAATEVITVDRVTKRYRIHWQSNAEFGVLNYRVQRSTNKVLWTTLDNSILKPKYLPDSNFYVFTLPVTSNPYYYRIYATMAKGKVFVSIPVYRKSTKN